MSSARGTTGRRGAGPAPRRAKGSTANQRRRIVIVGAGDCGTRAPLTIRQAGWDGELTLIGDEVHVPHERRPRSKAVGADGRRVGPLAITSAKRLADHAIAWEPGLAAKGVDRGGRPRRRHDAAPDRRRRPAAILKGRSACRQTGRPSSGRRSMKTSG